MSANKKGLSPISETAHIKQLIEKFLIFYFQFSFLLGDYFFGNIVRRLCIV